MKVGEKLPKNVLKWLTANATKFPNVIGFSAKFQNWNSGENTYPIPVVRFYVKHKIALADLKPEDIIPKQLSIGSVKKSSYKTDVVEIGEVKVPPIPDDVRTSAVDKTQNFRPVELGVSVGNEAITAGSLGMLYEGIDGCLYCAGSNAHVVTPNAGMSIEEVKNSGKINILQRGAYHGGKVPDDVVGTYLWHQQIFGIGDNPSSCPVSNIVIDFLNFISKLFGRQSRFKVLADQLINNIDFGLYKASTEHILKIADNSINPHNIFIGHLYAGSDTVGIICKIKNIMDACPYPIKPLNGNWGEVEVGDKVKGCSFWCNYETEVIDTDGIINVSYGNFVAIMTDAIIVKNNGTIKGGWSGSGWFKV